MLWRHACQGGVHIMLSFQIVMYVHVVLGLILFRTRPCWSQEFWGGGLTVESTPPETETSFFVIMNLAREGVIALPLSVGYLTRHAFRNGLTMQNSVMIGRPAALQLIMGSYRQGFRCSPRRYQTFFASLFSRGHGRFGQEIVPDSIEQNTDVRIGCMVGPERSGHLRAGVCVYGSSRYDGGMQDSATNGNGSSIFGIDETGDDDILARGVGRLADDMLVFGRSPAKFSTLRLGETDNNSEALGVQPVFVRDEAIGVKLDEAGRIEIGVQEVDQTDIGIVASNITTRKTGGKNESGAVSGENRPIGNLNSRRLTEEENSWPLSSGSRPAFDFAPRDAAGTKMKVRPSEDGRRLRWDIDIDLEVPTIVEKLLWGPWDPNEDIWTRQVDMAEQVIIESNGVVFLEQLAPILNPRGGPSKYDRGRERSLEGSTVIDETIVVGRLLSELNGVPEVTNDGDILYVFSGLGRAKAGVSKRDDFDVLTGAFSAGGSSCSSIRLEVLQFEEVPGLLATLPKIPQKGPKVVTSFFQRAVLIGIAVFLSQCLLLLKLLFGSSPVWLAVGPLYLAWVAVDDSLKRSRGKTARERDRWRAEWAQVCRGDGNTVWRKRVSARLRARRLLKDGI